MTSLRNGHANRLYAASADAFDYREKDLPTNADVDAYTAKVVRSACFRRLWAEYHRNDLAPRRGGRACPKKVTVRHYTGGTAYHRYGTDSIAIGSARHSRYVVLHELAHVIDPNIGHGWSFARIYLALVRRFMPDHAEGLVIAYRAHRVRYRKPAAGSTLDVMSIRV